MEARFAWSEQIAEEVTQESLIAIAQQVGTGLAAAAKDTEGTSRVVVFNPTASLRTDRACVRIRPTPPAPWGLVDAEGRTVPHRVLGSRLREQYHEEMDSEMLRTWVARAEQRKGQIAGHLHIHGVRAEREEDKALVEIVVGSEPVELQPGDLACVETLLADRQIEHFQVRAIEDCGTEIEFLARDVPGVGYASLAVAHTRPSSPPPGIQAALAIENEFFRVAADRSHGTLTVIDKGTGLVLEGANRFVDGGDRGDEYTYCPPEWDRLVDAPAAPPSVRCADDGLGSTLEIAMHYRLPRALADGDRARRSSDEVELPITSRVTLTPGVRRIEFETWLDNRARDHRLRVHFPTPICTDRSWAEGHFDIVERPVARPTDTEGWAEQPVGTHPQLGFVDVNDGQRGLLLANRGLPEYEILPGTGTGGGVTLALTLLRCVGWLSRADLHNREGHAGPPEPVPEAQCLGEHRCHYALIPHAGNYLSAFQEAHAFNAPLRAVHIATQCGPLPSNGRFVEVSPAAVVLTCIKPPVEGKGLVVRIYNSAPVPVRARLKLWRPFHRADLVPLSEEETLQRLAEAADHVSLPLRPKAIATVRFSFDVDLGYA
jgi:alpha-mannosidase